MEQGHEPATKADLQALRADLNALEIRLRQDLASKADLQTVRDELKGELKENIQTVKKELTIEIIETNGRLERMEERLTHLITAGNSRMMKLIEDFASEIKKIDRREIITGHRVNKLENRVQSLERSR